MALVVRSEGLNTASTLRIIDKQYPYTDPQLDTELLNIIGKINELYNDILSRLGVVSGRIDANIPQTLPIKGTEGALIIGQGDADALYKDVTGEVEIDKEGVTEVKGGASINTATYGDITRAVDTEYTNGDKNRFIVVSAAKTGVTQNRFVLTLWVSLGGNTVTTTESDDIKKVSVAASSGAETSNDACTLWGIIPPGATYSIVSSGSSSFSIEAWSETDFLH